MGGRRQTWRQWKDETDVEELLEIFRSPLNKEELLDKISDYHEKDIAEAFEHSDRERAKEIVPAFWAQGGMAEIFTYIEEPDGYPQCNSEFKPGGARSFLRWTS